MTFRKFLVIVFVLAVAAPALAQDAPALDSDEKKTLYALGLALGNQMGPFSLSEADLKIVQRAIEDAVLGREPAVDLQTWGPKIRELQQSRQAATAGEEKAASAKFLEEMRAKDGAKVYDSGLIMFTTEEGSGESPDPTDTVKVHYHGTLRSGKVFDSSRERGEPTEFPLNRVIPCWTEALQKMKVGGKATVVCPSDIAYGDRGAGSDIKPGAALVFDVELLEIKDQAAATP